MSITNEPPDAEFQMNVLNVTPVMVLLN